MTKVNKKIKANGKEGNGKSPLQDTKCPSLHTVPSEVRMLNSSCSGVFLQFICGTFKKKTKKRKKYFHAHGIS